MFSCEIGETKSLTKTLSFLMAFLQLARYKLKHQIVSWYIEKTLCCADKAKL